MVAQIRVLRRQIQSTQSIKKITRAMELVAASRIGRARARAEEARPYAEEMIRVLTELASNSALDHPLLVTRKNTQRAAVLVVASDRGLCGGFNHNVLKAAEELRSMLREQGKQPVLYVIGRKGVKYYKFRHTAVATAWTGFSEQPSYTDAVVAARVLVAAFMAGHDDEFEGVDELHLVYTQFQNMAIQTPRARRMAPLQIEYAADGTVHEASEGLSPERSAPRPGLKRVYTFEPDANSLFHNLLPRYIGARLYAALLESAASESAHRQRSMKAATDNANEMISALALEANRARQDRITEDILEVANGAEALRSSAHGD